LADYKVLVSLEFLQIERPLKPDRGAIVAFLEGLAKDPFQRGDYEERDEAGRSIQIKIVSKYALTYWANQHEKEQIEDWQTSSADGHRLMRC